MDRTTMCGLERDGARARDEKRRDEGSRRGTERESRKGDRRMHVFDCREGNVYVMDEHNRSGRAGRSSRCDQESQLVGSASRP